MIFNQRKEAEAGENTRKVYSMSSKTRGSSSPSTSQEEYYIQPKKRSRRRHRENSMSPTTRGSSSPSTSQEENQRQALKRRRVYSIRRKDSKKGKRKEGLSSSTETDDSSSDCEISKNISETESKYLIKVFSRFFGRLCFAIKAPVELATRLQMKGLLKYSLMTELLMSPETEQAKSITLVGALQKKIKSHPDKMFNIIEVFLGDEVLQQTGKEMLTEIGKICPERSAFIFGSILPPPGNLAKIQGNEPHILKTDASYFSERGGASSVSQFLTQRSGTSLVLGEYKKYLQSCYNARVLAPADKYLPTLESPYISLAMIRRGRYNHEQRDAFTRQTLHGGVDQILENKKPINIEDLLTPEDSGRPVRFILVEGPPGIGKSTFAWEVCRRWDEIESLRDYHTVVLLKLREKWVSNATKPSGLFRYPPDPELSNTVAKALNESHGHNLLLLLDGFEEAPQHLHENSVIRKILCRQLLPECTIILTTRPVAKYTLRSICQPRVDKHVEIIGFTEEERVRYITEVFNEEPELQVNFLKYMFLVPHIKSIMYIPLNCAIIAQVYCKSQSSCYLAISRTKTQVYKNITRALLVRHMTMKETSHVYEFTLPEDLKKGDIDMFKKLAKSAFDSYHNNVSFIKQDVNEGLVHFGFMNQSSEIDIDIRVKEVYLSLQEYLAAWHLADSYSIEFQVAYHRLALDGRVMYKGDNKEEKALISSLEQQRSSLVEPAIFLAGITGWKCQSEDDKNHWEMYLSHDTLCVGKASMLLQSLYEAQNPTLFSHYFIDCDDSRRKFFIGSLQYGVYEDLMLDPDPHTPYDCYAISYCLANSSDQLCYSFSFGFNGDNDISLVETFVKGLHDHCLSNIPRVKHLEILESSPSLVDRGLLWLMRANFLATVEECVLHTTIINNSGAQTFLSSLVNLQSLEIQDTKFPPTPIISWEWLAGVKSLSELKVLHISSSEECSPPPTDIHSWLKHGLIEGDNKLTEVVLDIKFPFIYDLHSRTDILVKSVLISVLRSNKIYKMELTSISRETMAGVHNILLHCPSLTTLELKRTRLGYDGILYICSALRNNTTLRHLVIHDDLRLIPRRDNWGFSSIRYINFLSMERVPLPGKTTCTDFLLELNNILKDNTTLEEMKIQSGLFLPPSAGEDGEYCQWTGLGPLQQFNVGAVGSGMCPNLRRSFSSSDVTQPQTTLFWDRQFLSSHLSRTLPHVFLDRPFCYSSNQTKVDFKKLFSKRKEKGKKLFSLPSFTAPDTEVLQSFSGLDPRLKECLEISHLHKHVQRLRDNALFIESSPVSVDPLSTALSQKGKESMFGSSMSTFEPEESVMYVGKACSYTSQTGVSLHFPAGECQTPIKVSVKVVSGDYTLPPEYEGMPLVSSMFKITASDELPAPITVQMKHCAVPEKENSLVHVVAHDGPPYHFQPLHGGIFPPGKSYGEIQLTKFSFIGIILDWLFRWPISLSVRVFYYTDSAGSNFAIFVATKNLPADIQAIMSEYSTGAIRILKHSMLCDPTTDEICLIIPPAQPGEWCVTPGFDPRIKTRLILEYGEGKTAPSIPLNMKWTGKKEDLKDKEIKIKLEGTSGESFTLFCSANTSASPIQNQQSGCVTMDTSPLPEHSTSHISPSQSLHERDSVESKALRRSYAVFTSGVDPENLVKVLYSNFLLTPEEEEKAMQPTLTDSQKLRGIFKAMERCVSVEPSVFHTLLKALKEEPATKRVAKRMRELYDDEHQKVRDS